ncbi:MAG: hypothetical protein LBH06_03495, partial [Rikenellaceae bacterium]|nr:hypothetical protein [Rikenellaceae bacterium]
MATSKRRAAEVADYSMEEKIIALYELQKIDSRVDEIEKVKGELPLEVQDLEDEIEGLETRIKNIGEEITQLGMLANQRKGEIEQARILITHYQEQQNNVRNNREFDALSKEIEFQNLEIELGEKRLKEYSAEVKVKKKMIEDAQAVIDDRKIDFKAKKSELESIEQETAKSVAALREQAAKA